MSKVTFELNKQVYELPEFLSIQNYIKIYKVKDFLGEEYFQLSILRNLLISLIKALLILLISK